MIDEVEDEYGDDEPSSTRADWAALRERLLEQRRRNLSTDSYELGWFAHRVGKLIPDFADHPLFLATLRTHWLGSSTVSAHGDPDLDGVEGVSSDAHWVVTIDPDDLRDDLPGVAREVKRTLMQHPWQRATPTMPAGNATLDGRSLATALLGLRGYRRSSK